MKPIITDYQARVAADFSSEKPCVESYRRGALAIMEKDASKRRPVYAISADDLALNVARGLVKLAEPIPYVPPRKKGDGSPESKAAFKEWLDVPESDRYKGLGTAIARKHGAVPQHVLNRISRWKKENKQHE